MLKGSKAGPPIEGAMARHQKPIDSPGTVAERLMERRQCPEGTTVPVELPDRKTESAFGAIDPEHLPALPPGVDRHPRRAKQLGEGFSTQHVLAGDNFGNTLAATRARSGKSRLELGIGLARVVDGKGIDRLLLDRRDRLRIGGRVDFDPERYAVADLAAACDRFLITFKQNLLEVCLCRQFCGEAQGGDSRMRAVPL